MIDEAQKALEEAEALRKVILFFNLEDSGHLAHQHVLIMFCIND